MTPSQTKNILIIQTAFIGDTILAGHFAQAVKNTYPQAKVHFFLRKGNESVIQGLAWVDKVWIWDKKGGKTRNLFQLISKLRGISFDMVFNLHRHFNSGLVTALMKSPVKIGFKQNPLSFFYTHRLNHQIPDPQGRHEVQRNLELLPGVVVEENPKIYKPSLPLEEKHFEKIAPLVTDSYFVIAPASVWLTKAWSEHKYRELTHQLAQMGKVYFIGAPSDKELGERIRKDIPNTENLCGDLTLLESAALMKSARRVFVNDSAPLHLASCVNAKTTAIFCSTIPDFGYTPLADDSVVIDVGETLPCRPCGLHGHQMCPLGHFKCSENIELQRVLKTVI